MTRSSQAFVGRSCRRQRPASGRQRRHPRNEHGRRQPHHVLLVEPVQLLRVEDGIAPADALGENRSISCATVNKPSLGPAGDQPSSARKLTIASGR